MTSELLPLPADFLAPGATAVEEKPSPGEAGRRLTAVDASSFAVDWQVRPSRAEPDVANPDPPTGVPAAVQARGFTFEIARALGTVVVTARGTVDQVGARVLEHVLVDLIENQGNMTVVVDLHGVSDVDLGCVDVFLTAHHCAIVRGGQLSLTGARLRVARALEVTGVSRLVKVTSDRILAVPATRGVA